MTEEQVNELERSHGLISDGVQHTQDVSLLVAEVRRLRQVLREFGQHADTCGRAHYLGNVPCRCGLDAALGGRE